MSTNVFKRLKALLPDPPLMLGEVIASDAGVCTIELPGGGRLQVRGDAPVGQHVFIRNGVVESEAPDLPVDEIDV